MHDPVVYDVSRPLYRFQWDFKVPLRLAWASQIASVVAVIFEWLIMKCSGGYGIAKEAA
jgi:hypothetical protein